MDYLRFLFLFLFVGLIAVSCSDDTPTSPDTGNGDSNGDGNGEITEYTLVVTTSPEEGGSVEPDGESEYEEGEEVEVTASPEEGWEFSYWEGDIDDEESIVEVTIDEDKSITAVFIELEPETYSLEISTEGEGQVSTELLSGNEDNGNYEEGSIIELTVEPSDGWTFVHWDDDLDGTDNPIEVMIDQDLLITAVLDDSPFAGGNGTQEYPYELETLDQLQEVRDYTGKHFIQIDHIDASITENWNGGAGFNPIGDDIVRFTGTFDGGRFEISGLTINREDESRIGLFGVIGEDGVVANIDLIDVEVVGSTNVGSLAGYSYGQIENVSVHGSVHGNGNVGGLVGYQRYNGVSSSVSHGSVEGSGSAGGLIGYARSDAEIINSLSSSDVKSTSRVGGLIGQNGALVIESYASGNVEGHDVIGGLIGENTFRGKVLRSFANGDVTGEERVGGLIGSNGQTFSNLVANSYATGNVNGTEMAGGLIGANGSDGEVVKSYSVGQVTGNIDVGGIIGVNGGDIEELYWDTESSGEDEGIGRGTSSEAIGLTASEMTGSSAQNNMSDFDWDNVWMTTSDYPILQWQE